METVASLQKKIKDLEHREKYSKNQMEKRNLRSQIGQLQRDLVVAKKMENYKRKNVDEDDNSTKLFTFTK